MGLAAEPEDIRVSTRPPDPEAEGVAYAPGTRSPLCAVAYDVSAPFFGSVSQWLGATSHPRHLLAPHASHVLRTRGFIQRVMTTCCLAGLLYKCVRVRVR